MKILVTGGAGFIGTNLVVYLLERTHHSVVVLDALTYAGNLENINSLIDNERCWFEKASITDRVAVDRILTEHNVDAIIHLAAESHVDRSIMSAEAFITTNVFGTLVLAEESRKHNVQRFVHVSTDEVYGTLGPTERPFTETHLIAPSSPYSASKAGSDHIIASFVVTHGMDAVITRCSNNYGKFQFPEKLIPLMILNALEGRPLPVYGDGKQIRDWLNVEDHCAALVLALEKGRSGQVYNIGGNCERTNIEVVERIVELTGASRDLITHVTDRPGHDRRYAIDSTKISHELGWEPSHQFEEALQITVAWYKENTEWCDAVRSGAYRDYYEQQYLKQGK